MPPTERKRKSGEKQLEKMSEEEKQNFKEKRRKSKESNAEKANKATRAVGI